MECSNPFVNNNNPMEDKWCGSGAIIWSPIGVFKEDIQRWKEKDGKEIINNKKRDKEEYKIWLEKELDFQIWGKRESTFFTT